MFDHFFSEIVTDNGDIIEAACDLCRRKKTVIHGQYKASSNFSKHVQRVHGKTHLEKMHNENKMSKRSNAECSDESGGSGPPRKQPRLDTSYTTQLVVSTKNIEQLIVSFVVQDLQPLSVVEGSRFRQLIEGLNPKAKSICTETLKVRLQSKFATMSEKIKATLQSQEYVCTTADIWTQQARSYLGVTCHWIDTEEFKRHSIALAFRRFRGVHSYDRIASQLMDIHADFDLDTTKIVHVVTDNGSNFVKAFREYAEPSVLLLESRDGDDSDTGDRDSSGGQEVDENVSQVAISPLFTAMDSSDTDDTSGICLPPHLSCFSHTMNLLASADASKALQDDAMYKRMYRTLTGKCSALSNAAHQSSKAAEAVFDVLGRTVPKPNATRWNSEYDSYRMIYDVKDKVNVVMERLHLPKFTSQDLAFLGEWLTVMTPITTALDKLQGESTTESHFGAILPTLTTIQRKLSSFTPTLTVSLMTALQAGIQNRFGDILNLDDMTNSKTKSLIVAAVAHPFFKVRWIHSAQQKLMAQDLFVSEVVRIGENSTPLSPSNAGISDTNSAQFYDFQETESDATDSACKVEALQFLSTHHMNLISLNATQLWPRHL